jgi:hypothetical protein
MCVACHTDTDPNYPSTLFLGLTRKDCGDCHMKTEMVDDAWVVDMDKPVHLAVNPGTGVGKAARATAQAVVAKALRERGFRLVEQGETELVVTLELRLQSLRDDRFLPRGTPVRVAVLDARVTTKGDEIPHLRRLGVSKPEWGKTAEEATTRAIADAWAVLSPHLLEALAIR